MQEEASSHSPHAASSSLSRCGCQGAVPVSGRGHSGQDRGRSGGPGAAPGPVRADRLARHRRPAARRPHRPGGPGRTAGGRPARSRPAPRPPARRRPARVSRGRHATHRPVRGTSPGGARPAPGPALHHRGEPEGDRVRRRGRPRRAAGRCRAPGRPAGGGRAPPAGRSRPRGAGAGQPSSAGSWASAGCTRPGVRVVMTYSATPWVTNGFSWVGASWCPRPPLTPRPGRGSGRRPAAPHHQPRGMPRTRSCTRVISTSRYLPRARPRPPLVRLT